MRRSSLVVLSILIMLAIACDEEQARELGERQESDYDHVLELSGTYTASEIDDLIDSLPKGSVFVRPAVGEQATIDWGSEQGVKHDLPRADIAFVDLEFTGALNLADRTVLLRVDGDPFVFSASADDVVIKDSVFSGGAGSPVEAGCVGNFYSQNMIDVSDSWSITGSQFLNYLPREGEPCCSGGPGSGGTGECPSGSQVQDHSEALFIGADTSNIEIRDNEFENNGNTGHIFLTWWYCGGSYQRGCEPRNICIEENLFGSRIASFDIDVAAELPNGSRVFVDPNQTFSMNGPNGWVRPCPR